MRFRQQLFEFGQFAVLQLGHFVEVTFACQLFNLLTQLVNFFANVLAALRLCFFGLPNFFQIGGFFFQAHNFFFDQAQAFLRCFIGFFFHRLTFNLQLNQTAVQLIDDFRFGVDFNFDFGSCFINQVNGLVWQKSIGDVAMAKLCRCHDGRIGNVNAVVNFVLFLQATQNGNGGLHTGLAHQDLLKTTL